MKIIRIFFILFLLIFSHLFIYAEENPVIVEFNLNGNMSNLKVDKDFLNPIEIKLIANQNIQNWVSVTIKNIDDESIYKRFQPRNSCDNMNECIINWTGDISPQDKILVDGDYSIIIHIENESDPVFDLEIFSPYIINISSIKNEENEEKIFDLELAMSYLKNNQKENGSFFDDSFYSDWVMLVFVSDDISDTYYIKLFDYLKSDIGEKQSLLLNNLRIFSILSIGENPYSFQDKNYIDNSLKFFNGVNFGEDEDIYENALSIIALSKSGFTFSDEEIYKTIDFIISKQKEDGSWDSSIKNTSMVLQSFLIYKNEDKVNDSIQKAILYLQNLQQIDGGFGSTLDSAYVLQFMNQNQEIWIKENLSTRDYFDLIQKIDGSVLKENTSIEENFFATLQSFIAMNDKYLLDILKDVSKIDVVENIDVENNTNMNKTSGSYSTNNQDLIVEDENNTEKVWTDEEIKTLVENILKDNPPISLANFQNTENEEEDVSIDEDLIKDLDLVNLSANASDSNKNTTWPIIFGSIGAISMITFLIRRFLV